MTLFAGVTFAHFWTALLGALTQTAPRALLNIGSVGFAVLIYLLVFPFLDKSDETPIQLLWKAVLVAFGLPIALLIIYALFGPVHMDSQSFLSDDFTSTVATSILAIVETLIAIVILHLLRPLVLFKASRTSRLFWRGMLLLIVLSALSTAALQANSGYPIFTALLLVCAVFAMVYCAFRLSWIVTLEMHKKLAAIVLAVTFACLLGGALLMRFLYLNSVEGVFESQRFPAVHLFSRSLGDLVTFVLVFGVLYGITAFLSVVFHLPTNKAFVQQSGEIQAFKALAELSHDILDRDRLIHTIANTPVRTGIADSAWLALSDSRSGSLAPQVVSASGVGTDVIKDQVNVQSFVQEVTTSGNTLVLDTAIADHRIQARPGKSLGSLVVLPIVAGGETYGALFAAKPSANGFEQEDVGALEGFVGQAALALSHASLFADALEKERLAKEFALAREVQQRLLPQTLPEISELDIAVAEHAAQEIAGDYYDVADFGDGSYGFLVADVAGKGAAAAFYMAELKGVFQSTARSSPTPGAFLASANEALASSLGSRAFISAVYAVLNTRTKSLTVARAGHCPVVMSRSGKSPELLRGNGIGLGLDNGLIFRQTIQELEIKLANGDLFALFTDGLVETRNTQGEEFGYDRISHALQQSSDKTAKDILADLLARQQEFSNSRSHDDDLTVLILRWQGDTSIELPPNGQPPYILRSVFN